MNTFLCQEPEFAVQEKENTNMEWGKAKKNTESSVAVLTSIIYVN